MIFPFTEGEFGRLASGAPTKVAYLLFCKLLAAACTKESIASVCQGGKAPKAAAAAAVFNALSA
ncbi:MAG: hypothetical protein IJY17_03270, partial [Alphaproteobacteria bacterium]|nr:hypothetical protein [Alphaproteobacteria bacterium]